jgi:hypothetical protein
MKRRISAALRLSGCTPALLMILLGPGAGVARAQTVRLTVDPVLSLAWWQVNPHLGHLWATTCPADPSWRPGEGISVPARGYVRPAHMSQSSARTSDERIPLYPRRAVRPLCAESVSGEITAGDTTHWRNLRGFVSVRGENFVSGLDMRDRFARTSVLETQKYPEIRFRIDSLTSVVPGDTIRAMAMGVFSLHGVDEPMTVPVTAWSEAGGLRVQAKFDMPAEDLIDKYHLPKWGVGIGVTAGVWYKLHMGIDVVLKPAPAGSLR